MGKIVPLALVLVMIAASVLVIPNSKGDSQGESYVNVTLGGPDVLDPAVDYETAGGEVIQNVYETLLWYDGGSASELAPRLALEVPSFDNGGISPDGLTYTFHLRDGVMFHNGDTMTAEDVSYSIKRVLMINYVEGPAWMLGQVLIPDYYSYDGSDVDHPSYIPETECAKAIWAKGPMEVQFNLTRPYSAFNNIMAYTVGSIISKRFVEENGGISPGEQNTFVNSNTCGTGPYYLNIWNAPYIYLTRYDQYWQGPASIPYVLIWAVNDYDSRLMMLESGEADTIYINRMYEADVSSNPDLRIIKDDLSFTMAFLGFNQQIDMANDPAAGTDTIPFDFFSDVNVRKAFAHAFDYDAMIEDYYLGGAKQPNGVIPEGMFGYDPTVPTYDYNLTLAAMYLNNAVADNGTGETWGDRGFTVTVMYNVGNMMRQTECELLAQGLGQLSSLGLVNGTIQVNIMAMEWPDYSNAMVGKGLPLFLLDWMPDYADPDDYVTPFLYSEGSYAKRCGIDDWQLDGMVEAASSELNDSARIELYGNITSYVHDQCLYLCTAQLKNFHVERTWVHGYFFNPMQNGQNYYSLSFQSPPPGMVSGVKAFSGESKVLIVWDQSPSVIQYYNVYRSDVPGGNYTWLASTVDMAYMDESVVNGQTYYYTITAVNDVGEGPFSSEVMATPDPGLVADSLWIQGDAQLLMFQSLYGWPGSGTSDDPIIISGLDIDASGIEAGICLRELSWNVVVTGCSVSNASSTYEGAYGAGLVLDHVIGTTVQGCAFYNNELSGVSIIEGSACIVQDSVFVGGRNGLNQSSTQDCQFNDNTISNTTGPGIYAEYVDQCSWTGNVITNTTRGIDIQQSNNCLVGGNVLGQKGDDGSDILLQMLSSNGMTVQNNTFHGNLISMGMGDPFHGIGLSIAGYNNIITENEFLNCSVVWAEGYEMDRSTIQIDPSNTVNGRPVYLFHDVDMGGAEIPNDAGAVLLSNVQNVRLSGANLSNCSVGLLAYGCTGLVVTGCTINDCNYGIHIYESNACSVSDSTFSRNTFGITVGGDGNSIADDAFQDNGVGLFINSGNFNVVQDNHFLAGMYGTGLWGYNGQVHGNVFENCSSFALLVGDAYNIIYLNQFHGNNGAGDVYDPAHVQAMESSWSMNQWYYWDNISNIGNYWSDQLAPDSDLDGIVDNPYLIEGGGYDMRPIARLTGPPGSITQFNAIGQDAAILLQWNPPGNAMVVGVTSYDIYRWEGTDRVLLANVPYPTNEYIDQGLELGREYTYQISAINIDGEGPLSINVTGVPVSKPGAPRQLMGSISNGTVALSWNAPTDSDMANIDFYVVYMNGKDIKHVEGNSTDITGLSFGKYYSFSVAAHNALGEGPLGGSILVMQSGAPEAPMLLANFLDVSCELTWTRPSDGGPEIVHYQLYRSNASGVWALIATTEWRNYTDVGLVNGEPYRYKVCAVNELGMGPSSNVVNGTPLPWPGEMRPPSMGPISPDNVSGGSTLDTGDAGLGDGAGPVGHASVWGWLVGMAVLGAVAGTALWRGRKGS